MQWHVAERATRAAGVAGGPDRFGHLPVGLADRGGTLNVVNEEPDPVTRGSVEWTPALAQNLPDGRSATPRVDVPDAPPSPVPGSYEQLLAVVNRHAAVVRQKSTDLPAEVRDSPELADFHTELASLGNQLDGLISAADRSARRYFLLGLACAVPVGLLGSFLAFLLGWS
jgi:hypothetical protein